MVGVAGRDKELAIEVQRREAAAAGELRRTTEGAINNTFIGFPQNSPKPSASGGDRFLKKDGDIMRGGIAHAFQSIIINTGAVGTATQLINDNRIILIGEGSVDDDALFMAFPKFQEDMVVYISNAIGFGDITLLNDNTNVGSNFRLTGDADLLLENGEIHMLWYDIINDLWREISDRVVGAGGGGEVFTWTNSHSAGGFDLTSLRDIIFNAGGATISSSGSGIDHDVASGLSYQFRVNTSSVMAISSAGVTIAGTLAMIGDINLFDNNILNINRANFDDDNYIESATGGNMVYHINSTSDEHQLNIGGVSKLRVTNSDVDFSVQTDHNGEDLTEVGRIKFVSSTPLSGSDYGWSGSAGDIFGNIQTGDSYFLRENGSTIVEIDNDGIDVRTGWYEMTERSDPGGLANHVRLWARDNGAGKTQFMARVGATSFIMATEV